jgi:hypothetical protein
MHNINFNTDIAIFEKWVWQHWLPLGSGTIQPHFRIEQDQSKLPPTVNERLNNVVNFIHCRWIKRICKERRQLLTLAWLELLLSLGWA